ncbi:divergent polysaccharide deacetylase family protein [Pelagibius litoralis]|uniref:Divergent polysaccharide deacetylase family protein n=1 Tax=Pelagibius litoralis TaxID=374515 RepID=A0A967C9Z2_9PROT|nr:divergent polysaccharide deacetylase family protein [Pelagibius litoralis]NIA67318.1 divergent polysaccharide deacetylase family protein [Pelagibius litoralis]
MKPRESQKSKRPGGEALWNAAAVCGLLLIGLIIGGFAGVLMDREGLLGDRGQVAGNQDAAPSSPQIPGSPGPVLPSGSGIPRTGTADASDALRDRTDAFDREALEAALQAAGDSDGEVEPPESADRPLAFAPPIPVPDRGLKGPAPWQSHAVAVAPSDGRPMIAIVLDDVGVHRRNAQNAIALPGPLTLSFMTYAEDLATMTKAAQRAGHELMMHVPMQPLSPTIDPGPNVLIDGLPAAELTQRLVWGLDRFEGYVGINNHMGSRFTASPEGMALVMGELKARGLLFLDSLTAQNSVAGSLAQRAGVPFAERDIFLDNEPDDRASIDRQLALLEQVARERGYAVGIGHPHRGTVAALTDWIPEMQARGFALVPISAVVRHRVNLADTGRGDG